MLPLNEIPPSPSFSIVTLWRGGWNAAQRELVEWFDRERFPRGAHFIWVTVAESETERQLRALWHARDGHGAGHSLELITTPEPRASSAVEKHQTVAALYNRALEKVSSELVLFVEDDVIAAPGAVEEILAAEPRLPADAAAIMAAYRSRLLPACMCASDQQGRYLPCPAHDATKPIECAWIGGGFTLYRTRWLHAFRPFFMEERAGIVHGWDVNLCRQIRSAGGRLFVHPGIRAQHRCVEVIRYCGQREAITNRA